MGCILKALFPSGLCRICPRLWLLFLVFPWPSVYEHEPSLPGRNVCLVVAVPKFRERIVCIHEKNALYVSVKIPFIIEQKRYFAK